MSAVRGRGTEIGAVVLVGGRSTRMGGGTKPLLEVAGRTLFDRAVAALTDAGCRPIVAAGPVLDAASPVHWVREDPPFTGPAAAIAAALGGAGVDAAGVEAAAGRESAPGRAAAWTMLLAGDLPRVDRVVAKLRALARSGVRGVDAHVFMAAGHPQWLAGVYRTEAVRAAIAALGPGIEGASCRALLGGLEIAWISDDSGITADIDTPEDLARIRAEFAAAPEEHHE